MTDCLFCKIANKEIPAEIIFENHEMMAFMDLKPVNPGHVLIIPKKHSNDFLDTSDHLLSDLTWLAKNIGKSQVEALGYEGFNVGINNGLAAGQVIMHFHCHVIPRRSGDDKSPWPRGEYAEGEMASTAEKLRSSLS